MVLLPAGVLLGRAFAQAGRRPAAVQTIARTSALAACSSPSSSSAADQNRKRTIHTDAVARASNPFAKDELLSRLGGRSVRRSRQSQNQASTSDESEDNGQLSQSELAEALSGEKWRPVYRYPPVRYAVLLARAKLAQTIASVTYLPYSAYNFHAGTVDATWFWSTASLAIAAPLLLFIFSRYLNRLVGVIAMNEPNEFVRVGYLSFWGRRRNKFFAVSDMLPLSEAGALPSHSLVKLSSFSEPSSFLLLPTRGAEIVDEERAQLLFGDLRIFDEQNRVVDAKEKQQ